MKRMIRKAVVDDAEKVANLAIQMWKSSTVEELTQEFCDYMKKEGSAIFLAMADECAVGFAQCGLRHGRRWRSNNCPRSPEGGWSYPGTGPRHGSHFPAPFPAGHSGR